MNDIEREQFFGPVTGFMYTMEWQKQALPRVLILLFLDDQQAIQTIADINKVVCAEIPDCTVDPAIWVSYRIDRVVS